MAAPFGAANLGGVADARLGSVDAGAIGTHNDPIIHEVGPPDTHGHSTIYLDRSISFENYQWWAKRAREYETHIPANAGYTSLWHVLLGRSQKKQTELPQDTSRVEGTTEKRDGSEHDSEPKLSDEKTAHGQSANDAAFTHVPSQQKSKAMDAYGVSEKEWETAQRAGRTASWGAVFYLITTDILGPFTVPWAIAQLGFGPGIAIFVVFGVLAYYSAMQLWRMFCGLDSPRYPIRNYGDLGFRLFGNWMRVLANFLQSFQFFLNVAICIVANGQGLAQMAYGQHGKGFLCFIVAQLIFTLIGFALGQIRTLQRLGWLANISVWLNTTAIISTMAAVYIYPPNYTTYLASNKPITPVRTSAGLPSGLTLQDNVNGVFNGVFAFGGATMFNELMAEMRRPWDFWKSLIIAEAFITACYLIFGLVVYSRQGQYTFNPAFQGISALHGGYRLQTLGNAVFFITSVIAALLYGNIGLKVLYAAVLRDAFKFPPLDTKKGKLTWVVIVPVYWGLAFVLAAAVPQITNLSAFEGALTIMQFSYTFPPLFMVVYNIKRDSAHPDDTFDPATGETFRADSGPKRWWRGFKKQLLMNSWDSLYFLAALATAILGIWASVGAMVTQYKTTPVSSFTCKNPAGN